MAQPRAASPFDGFHELAKRVVSVPKKKIAKAETKWKQTTASRRKKARTRQGAKPSTPA
jgi:hypothetical protein